MEPGRTLYLQFHLSNKTKVNELIKKHFCPRPPHRGPSPRGRSFSSCEILIKLLYLSVPPEFTTHPTQSSSSLSETNHGTSKKKTNSPFLPLPLWYVFSLLKSLESVLSYCQCMYVCIFPYGKPKKKLQVTWKSILCYFWRYNHIQSPEAKRSSFVRSSLDLDHAYTLTGTGNEQKTRSNKRRFGKNKQGDFRHPHPTN